MTQEVTVKLTDAAMVEVMDRLGKPSGLGLKEDLAIYEQFVNGSDYLPKGKGLFFEVMAFSVRYRSTDAEAREFMEGKLRVQSQKIIASHPANPAARIIDGTVASVRERIKGDSADLRAMQDGLERASEILANVAFAGNLALSGISPLRRNAGLSSEQAESGVKNSHLVPQG